MFHARVYLARLRRVHTLNAPFDRPTSRGTRRDRHGPTSPATRRPSRYRPPCRPPSRRSTPLDGFIFDEEVQSIRQVRRDSSAFSRTSSCLAASC